ncbi:tropomyosin alpha-1 chain-like isoform X4 [Neltuma alba]|uniref:tropomyosin alpha-1 chain-like isoform X4 n=1 Tax=Neltuma alba TaxID=207710 RepID=UPI0010A3E7D1|nr:tropomyosin alpha-1 chain-like isoform X4 [Prosopis alba]
MDLPRDIDLYLKESIDDSLGLPVSLRTLESKLRASEESQRLLRQQRLSLLSKLKEKDQMIDRVKSEATMNAQALKKFVEENQKLASECATLLSQCHKWERECSLYDRDREALMEFGNEADERAKEAEFRAQQLEEELGKLLEELQYYKHEYNDGASSNSTEVEENLLDALLSVVTNKDGASAYTFLEANSGNEACKKLLTMWNCLKPSTRKVLSLVAEVKSLEKDKEHLRINLDRAEEEVKLLSDENNILNKENKRLLKLKERNHLGSGGKHSSSASATSNKRKSSPKTSSPIERKIDFEDMDTARTPLSPLQTNSPDSRMHKK